MATRKLIVDGKEIEADDSITLHCIPPRRTD